MQAIKHLDEISIAKIYLVLMFIVGLIADAIFLVAAGVTHGMMSGPIAAFGDVAFAVIAVIIPIVYAVLGFVFGAIFAFLYNVFANRIGGIKINLSGNKLMIVDPMSNGKILAVFGAIIGAIVGVVVLAFASLITYQASHIPVAGLLGVVIFLIFIVAFIIVFFIIGALEALLYNFLAHHIGPIILNFKGKELRSIGILSYMKIEGAAGLIIGFIAGLLTLSIIGFITQIIISPIASFIMGGIMALAYNLVANSIGGMRLTIS